MRETHTCPKCGNTRILTTDVGFPMVGNSYMFRATAYACAKCLFVEHYLRSPSDLSGLWKELPAKPKAEP
jgi:predicted nucleic-acid-binding Zn-ribbon protein